MSDYTPKNPESLETYDAILAEYNTIFNTEYQFFFDEHPRDVDFLLNQEHTVDGHAVWVMRANEDGIYLSDNVYYNQPDGYDLLREVRYGADDSKVYCEIAEYEVQEALLDRLYTNYDNYLQELEDEK